MSIELIKAIGNEDAVVVTAVKKGKKTKCPYCDKRCERKELATHIQHQHEEMIPEGYTALRVAFNTLNNKEHGSCIICKGPSDWNEDKGRYERLCNNPACKEKYKAMVAARNKKKYGTERLQTDPKYAAEVQKRALAGRSISGVYTFEDGGKHDYVGSYEKQFLEYMDLVMHCKSEDLIGPGPTIHYTLDGKEHLYLPDFLYIPYNLLIEIKDGGDNPNKHPKRIEEERKNKAKEAAVMKLQKYSYVRIVNNNFGQLLSIMALLKYQLNDETVENKIIIMANESARFMNESEYKSSLDADHKQKEKMSLSDFNLKKEENKKKSVYLLKWYDGKHLVGKVEVDTEPASDQFYYFGSLEVSPKYRSHGLGTQITRFVQKNYHAGALAVAKDNQVAIELYKKCGFVIGKPSNTTPKNYYNMYYNPNKQKSIKENIDTSSINTIVFDLGKVLIHSNMDKAIPESKIWAEQHGITHDEFMYLLQFVWNVEEYDSLAQTKKKLRDAVEPKYKDLIIEVFYWLQQTKEPFPYTIKLLDTLKKKGYKLYYLSNLKKSYYEVRKKTKLYDFTDKYMEGGIFSCNVHCMKPDPQIYQLLIDKYHLIPDNCLFVDDKEVNVETAINMGFHGMVFNNPDRCSKQLMQLEAVKNVNEDMVGTIGAALPPGNGGQYNLPDSSGKENYYLVQYPQNNVFAYGITKDPVQNILYTVEPTECENCHKVSKKEKKDIPKEYQTFKIKDRKTAEEFYEELALMVKSNKTKFFDERYDSTDYLYERITNGSKIIDENQLLLDARFELVDDPDTALQELCHDIYTYLKGKKTIDLLEEQVNDLTREYINGLFLQELSVNNNAKELTLLSNQLQRTSSLNESIIIKDKITALGWNPEIPYTYEAGVLSDHINSNYILLNEIYAEEFLKQHKYDKPTKTNMEPVFVVFTSKTAMYTRAIQWFTHSKWSHTAIAFKPDLKETYTYLTNDRKRKSNGFGVEGIDDFVIQDPRTSIKIGAFFVTPEQLKKMKNQVKWYLKNQEKTSYNMNYIVRIASSKDILNKEDKAQKMSLICSLFTYNILKIARFKLYNGKVFNNKIISPGELDFNSIDNRYFVVYEGYATDYNEKRVVRLCDEIKKYLKGVI